MAENPQHVAAIAARHATVADKIRALAGAGVPRADIARFLGKRYQHVRNVLEGDAQSSPTGGGSYVIGKADLSGVREDPRPFDADDDATLAGSAGKETFWLRVNTDGSLLLPLEVARVLRAEPGRRVFARVKDGQLVLMSAEAALAEAKAIVRKSVPRGVSLVDELIADRRAEAAREAADD